MKIIKPLPKDVKSLWWSGQYWYAASVESIGKGKSAEASKYHGIGRTKHKAVWDMRNNKWKRNKV